MSALRLEGTGRGAIAGTPTAFRGQSVCPFCPPQPVSPPLFSYPVLQPSRKLQPSFHSPQSHTSVPLHNPTPRSGHPLPLPLWSCLSHQENATLTGQLAQLPCLPITAAWEAGLGISRVVHYLDSPISFGGFCLPNGFRLCPFPPAAVSFRRGAWSPLRSPAPWPLCCLGKGHFSKVQPDGLYPQPPISSWLLQPPGLSPHSSAQHCRLSMIRISANRILCYLLPLSPEPQAKPNCSECPEHTWRLCSHVSTPLSMPLIHRHSAYLLHSRSPPHPALRILLLPRQGSGYSSL